MKQLPSWKSSGQLHQLGRVMPVIVPLKMPGNEDWRPRALQKIPATAVVRWPSLAEYPSRVFWMLDPFAPISGLLLEDQIIHCWSLGKGKRKKTHKLTPTHYSHIWSACVITASQVLRESEALSQNRHSNGERCIVKQSTLGNSEEGNPVKRPLFFSAKHASDK